MDCQDFEDRLQDLLAGGLGAPGLHAVEEHAAQCSTCGELLAIARGNLELLSARAPGLPTPEATPDITSAVLARTSGPACQRAQEDLCSLVDGALRGIDAELVSLHLERCARCRVLGDTLAWLAPELCALAVLEPDARFATGVLQATAGLCRRRLSRRAALAGWWDRLVQRPRFAWEVAYAGTLVVALLCGTPHSPFRGAPARALAAVQLDPVQAYRAAAQEVGAIRNDASAAGGRFWGAVSDPVRLRVRAMNAGFASRHQPLALAVADLRLHCRELLHAVRRGDLVHSSLLLNQVGRDLERVWQSRRRTTPAGTTGRGAAADVATAPRGSGAAGADRIRPGGSAPNPAGRRDV